MEGAIFLTFRSDSTEDERQEIVNNLYANNSKTIEGMMYKEMKEGVSIRDDFNKLGEENLGLPEVLGMKVKTDKSLTDGQWRLENGK